MASSRHPIVEQIPRLRRYARALRGNPADADDLVQDTLERAYSRWHLWKPGRDLRPWLFAIMHNVFVNQLKLARNRLAVVTMDEAEDLGTPAPQESVGQAIDLAAAVAKLPPAQRETLLLVTLEELTYAEAASVLDIPIGTVMSRLWAARTRLRELTSGGGAADGEKDEVTR
jgi:RNA polymerase sigma-70 factor, ECF subfamily